MLPSEAPLTPRALQRVSREASVQSFERAAAALSEDWDTNIQPKQLQRWVEPVGARLAAERDREVRRSESGRPPSSPQNVPQVLAVSLDGGRIQMREKNPETESRWRETKVAAITSYECQPEREPAPLVTTYVATLESCEPFGKMARVEAERRGLNRAKQLLALGDGGNWIDPLVAREFACAERILDWYHASEHLHDCAKAAHGAETREAKRLAHTLEKWLWNGQLKKVLDRLQILSTKLGPPKKSDGADHPRRVIASNLKYFAHNEAYCDYPRYRAKGWPIASGNVEAGIKQFNKRLKGTDQFWQPRGAEAMLSIRALWLCQDQRWRTYWSNRPAYQAA